MKKVLLILALFSFFINVYCQIPNYVPLNGLVGWWPFNGNANDESGNGNNGTVLGAKLTTDRNGQQAYKFDGIDDIINISSKVGNFGSYDFSVSLWVYDEDAQNGGTLVGKRNDDANMLNLVWVNSPGLELGSPYVLIAANGSMLKEWKNCVLVRKGVNISIWINGVLVQKNISSIPPNINNSANLSFGARYFSSQTLEHFKGSIDDIGIWNRSLTDDEIQSIYKSEQLTETKLSQEQYYKMVYEGESDNPYSSFEDYLASQKRKNESNSQEVQNEWKQQGTNQFVIPNSVLEISSALDQIKDTLDKITYLNNLISHVKKKSPNERTDWDISMYQASFNYKLFYILPNKCNDPRISQDEWISLNDFLNLLGDEAYKSEDSKDMRGCFLYFNILVKQKLGNNSVDIKWPKMVVNEFKESNFPYGAGFYNECQRIVEANNISNNNIVPKQDPVKPKSDPPLLATEPIGTIWYDANSGGKNVRFEKLSSQKYCLTWRDSYGDVNKLTAVVTSKELVTREKFAFCFDYYDYILTGEGTWEGHKIVFSYRGSDWLCTNSVVVYDELGSRWGYWQALTKK